MHVGLLMGISCCSYHHLLVLLLSLPVLLAPFWVASFSCHPSLVQVVRYKHENRDGVTSLVLGCGSKRAKQLHPRMLGEFQAAGVPLKRKLWECQVTEDALLPVGTMIGQMQVPAGASLIKG